MIAFPAHAYDWLANRPDPNWRHPVEVLEPEVPPADRTAELAEALNRVLAWLLDARSVNNLARRALVIGYVLRPAMRGGLTLEQIGEATNASRQHAHTLAVEFCDTFGLRHPQEKDCPRRTARD